MSTQKEIILQITEKNVNLMLATEIFTICTTYNFKLCSWDDCLQRSKSIKLNMSDLHSK